MSPSELADWKRHPVTQMVFATLVSQIQSSVEYLIESNDPIQEARTKGAIQAWRDILNTEFEDIKQETE